MPDAYLGLGSNLGDRLGHLADAVGRLHRLPHSRVGAVSAVYESKPVGNTAQPDFLNLVLRLETGLPPQELLAECLRIEAGLGRVRRERWGARTMDIDVLLYERAVLDTASLTLPHPRMKERGFVLVPLAEMGPDLMPDGESIRTLAAGMDRAGLRKVGFLDWRPEAGGAGPAGPGLRPTPPPVREN